MFLTTLLILTPNVLNQSDRTLALHNDASKLHLDCPMFLNLEIKSLIEHSYLTKFHTG
jgi:hypothetical protein